MTDQDDSNSITVQTLCIGADRSQQTVQTKIRLLLKKQSDQGLRCLPFHQHLLDALMQCYINFRVLGQLWQLFEVSQILEFLRYLKSIIHEQPINGYWCTPSFFLLFYNPGWSGGAMVLGKLPVPGRPTIWITVGQGPTALTVGAGGGCLDIFILIYPFSPLSPSLWETADID